MDTYKRRMKFRLSKMLTKVNIFYTKIHSQAQEPLIEEDVWYEQVERSEDKENR